MAEPHALITIKVSPKSSRTALSGWHGELLKLSVTAAPDRGRANAAVIELLSEVLDVAKSRITLETGHTQTTKRLRITGLDAATVQARIAAALAS